MTQYKVYGYRWVMLALFMVMVAANQVLWITFAPITVDAASFFKVSDLMIGILSMSFMIVYMVVSIPASWIIDTYGIKIGAGIGALLTGTFGLMRGWAGADFNMVLMAQIGIAIGQPFLLNSITKLSALWFPMEERATAAGLGTLAMYIGILAGMVVTPVLFTSNGLVGMMNVYGIGAAVIALIFLIFSRNAPPTPPCEAHGGYCCRIRHLGHVHRDIGRHGGYSRAVYFEWSGRDDECLRYRRSSYCFDIPDIFEECPTDATLRSTWRGAGSGIGWL